MPADDDNDYDNHDHDDNDYEGNTNTQVPRLTSWLKTPSQGALLWRFVRQTTHIHAALGANTRRTILCANIQKEGLR